MEPSFSFIFLYFPLPEYNYPFYILQGGTFMQNRNKTLFQKNQTFNFDKQSRVPILFDQLDDLFV